MVGTSRGFRTRERIASSGGMSGVEMDVDVDVESGTDPDAEGDFEVDVEGYVDVDGDGEGDGDGNGTTEDDEVDIDGQPIAGPSNHAYARHDLHPRYERVRKEKPKPKVKVRRAEVGEVASAFRAARADRARAVSLEEEGRGGRVPQLTVTVISTSAAEASSPRKGKGKAREGEFRDPRGAESGWHGHPFADGYGDLGGVSVFLSSSDHPLTFCF